MKEVEKAVGGVMSTTAAAVTTYVVQVRRRQWNSFDQYWQSVGAKRDNVPVDLLQSR